MKSNLFIEKPGNAMRLKILIIDDEECIRDSFKWHLEDMGHKVVTAPEPMLCELYSGHDCQLEHPCADLILIDYRMPRMTGLEFIELLSKRGCIIHPENRVLISGDTTSIDMAKVKQLGCQVLQKPISLDTLDKVIFAAEKNLARR